MMLLATCDDLPGYCCQACHEDDGPPIEEEWDLAPQLPVLIKTIRCCQRKVPERRDRASWARLAGQLGYDPSPASRVLKSP